MAYDYSKLRGRVVEMCGTLGEFAKRMGLSDRAISLKLNGKSAWTQKNIDKALEVLHLTEKDIRPYFFAR